MAENSSHVAPEATVIQSDDEEQRKELYPNTVERRNTAVENCDATTERTTNEKEEEDDHRVEAKSNREQELQIPTQIQQTDTRTDRKIDTSPDHISDVTFSSQRVYKKTSPNNKLTLYLASRDIIVSEAINDNKLLGVLLVDSDYVREKKVFGQVTLTFRYGREDEEVMGLKFCNEAMMCLAQLYPSYVGAHHLETCHCALAYPLTIFLLALSTSSCTLIRIYLNLPWPSISTSGTLSNNSDILANRRVLTTVPCR